MTDKSPWKRHYLLASNLAVFKLEDLWRGALIYLELEGFSKLEILRFSILLYSNDKGKLYWFKIVVQEFLFWSKIDLQRLDLLSYLKEKKKKDKIYLKILSKYWASGNGRQRSLRIGKQTRQSPLWHSFLSGERF